MKLVLKLIIHYTCTALHTLKISFTNIKSSPMQSCGKCKYCDEKTGCELVDLPNSKWLSVDSHLCLQVYFILFDTAADFHKWHNFYEKVKKKIKYCKTYVYLLLVVYVNFEVIQLLCMIPYLILLSIYCLMKENKNRERGRKKEISLVCKTSMAN